MSSFTTEDSMNAWRTNAKLQPHEGNKLPHEDSNMCCHLRKHKLKWSFLPSACAWVKNMSLWFTFFDLNPPNVRSLFIIEFIKKQVVFAI